MKRIAIGFLILALMLVFAVGCGRLSDVDKPVEEDTTPADTTTAEDTDSIQVSTDPTTLASSGLSFESKGDGTCRLVGMGSCTDTCLIIPDKSPEGDAVTAIGAGAFAGNTLINAVQIPAGVVEIGDGAFAGCPALSYISVSNGNGAYCDVGGMLYSLDKSTLLCVPAGNKLSSLTLTLQVTTVAPRATEGCNFTKILFEGTAEQWKKISVGASNDALSAVTPTYMKQSGK